MELDQPRDGAAAAGEAAGQGTAGGQVTAGLAGTGMLAPPRTGDDRADEAVAAAGRVAGRPLAEHAAVFEQVHARLVEVLGELDAGQPGAGQPGAAAPRAAAGAPVRSAEHPAARD